MSGPVTIREQLDNTLNGDADDLVKTPGGRATLRGLRVLAAGLDTSNAIAAKTSSRLQAIASTVGGGLILSAMVAALRLT